MAARARVFTIAPGTPFLPALADALLAGTLIPGFPGSSPLALSSATIYVPTQRAGRALAGALAEAIDAPAALLPRIIPLGRLESIETTLRFEAGGLDNPFAADAPDAVGDLARRLALARLVRRWSQALPHAIREVDGLGRIVADASEQLLVTPGAAQAWHLAGELAGLIDEMIIEGVPWTALDGLVPDDFDRYWGITLQFLQIAIAQWPRALAEQGLVDAATRSSLLLKREADRLPAGHDTDPVLVVGSTGTNQAVARLMAAVARAPQGAVVLPGLDQTLDDVAWQSIAGTDDHEPSAGHPQAALRRLLPVLGVERRDVVSLGQPPRSLLDRTRLVGEALRPADTTEHWLTFAETMPADDLTAALDGLTLIEAADEREEALAIAIRLREVLETPDATAALVTPDRDLARRVRADLRRWAIEVDDSGGEALGLTGRGTLARLIVEAGEGLATPQPCLALLTHPDVRLGFPAARMARLAHVAELAIFRAILPDAVGPVALVVAAREAASDRHAHRALTGIAEDDWRELSVMLERFHTALASLSALRRGASLTEWLAAHRQALAKLLDGDPEPDHGDDAETLDALFDELEAGGPGDDTFTAGDYAAFFDLLSRETAVRGPALSHPRLKILGLLEARLLTADVLVLGGLDETIWPPAGRTDPFLNRPMRAALGLSAPERRIGQTAHDWSQALGTPMVVMTRASKRGGAPTVPSRFLQRVAALAGSAAWDAVRTRGDHLLDLARALDEPAAVQPIRRPRPRPPLGLRPTSLGITRIETLRRDPYAIYAQRILQLDPLDPVGVEEGAAETGTGLHAVLADFVGQHPTGPLPLDARATLIEAARQHLQSRLANAEFRAFHWPRIEAAMDRFLEWEIARRDTLVSVWIERGGNHAIPLSDSTFRLTGIADRIERHRDGRVVVVDYKTGAVPTSRQISAGFAPQLPLEAAMVAESGFKDVPGLAVTEAVYVALNGQGKTERPVIGDGKSFKDLVAEQREGLLKLLEQFRDEATPYVPRPFPQWASQYGDYDHLARVKEWSNGTETAE